MIALRFKADNLKQKIADRASISGNSRRTGWLYKLATKGFLKEVDPSRAVKFAEDIDNMISQLKLHYGERWDFQLLPTENSKFKLVCNIHFPEITISNSNDHTHDIKDLFVSFEIFLNSNGVIPGELQGFRTTFTIAEWESRYAHSHLNSLPRIQSGFIRRFFCLGDGTSMVVSRENLMLGYSENRFNMYLFNIDSFVRWESLEGVPYKQLSRIRRANSEVEYHTYTYNQYILFDLCLPALEAQPLPLHFYGNKFKLNTEAFANALKEIAIDHVLHADSSSFKSILVVEKDGRYLQYNPLTAERGQGNFNPTPNKHFLFRDKEIKLKIITGEEEGGLTASIEDHHIHKDFVNYAKKKFEERIYRAELNRAVAEAYYKSRNASRGVAQNPVPL